MKKRSLFAAVAMLIVSALVLTSATYAWFAASEEATVSTISATVEGVDGALLLAATNTFSNAANTNLKTQLTASDWNNLQNRSLQPVSFAFGDSTFSKDNDPDIYKVKYDGSMFSADTAAATDYLAYAFKVQYSMAGTSGTIGKNVKMQPSLSIESDFTYILVRVQPYSSLGANEPWVGYIYAKSGSDTYTPVKAISGYVQDNHTAGQGTAGIVDIASIDAGVSGGSATLAAAVSPDNTSAGATGTNGIVVIPSTAPIGQTLEANVQVYMWAEGNDTNCTGTVATATDGIQFKIIMA